MDKRPVKLLDQVRAKIRMRQYSIRTEEAYTAWIRRFILFHNKRHPKDMGREEIEIFLTDLAINRNVASSTQNQALNALLFLYSQVLRVEFPAELASTRAKRPQKLPVVLSEEEVWPLIDTISGTFQLMARILYGSGLRGIECVRLRVNDVDFNMNQIVVRNGKQPSLVSFVSPRGPKRSGDHISRLGETADGRSSQDSKEDT